MSEWQQVRVVNDAEAPHCTPEARLAREWPKWRDRPVHVRFWGNAAKKWACFECTSGCDCDSFFEVLEIDAGVPYNVICRRTLEMD